MKILAIETSCDETAVAVLECSGDNRGATFKILGNALLSQIELHREYGGVVPRLAKREHTQNLPPLFAQALEESGCTMGDIDTIAVTAGPGLEPALWVGVNFAAALAREWSKPLVAVNHMEGHIISALAEKQGEALIIKEVELPLLALLISGGHTELVLMKNWLEYERIGQTRDDAVGEAFDKVARMLGLPYPGGPEISKLAEEARSGGFVNPQSDWGFTKPPFQLPRPMISDPHCDFSFSGLKTSVLYLLKSMPEVSELQKQQIAREFEDAVGDVLWSKTARALEHTSARALVLGGGVSNNAHLRQLFTKNIEEKYPYVSLHLPSASLTTDNALMIGLAGYFRAINNDFADLDALKANGNLSLV